MHEIIIQICFVVAGVVTGCTDGAVQTDNPYLSSQDISPVYVYDAPQCISNHYRTSYTPPVPVGSLRLSWPTYTSHHSAWPSCTHAYSHYHGSRWFTWKKRYVRDRHSHHAHRSSAHHGGAHHGHHKKSKVIVVKPKVKVGPRRHHHNTRPKVVVKPRVKKHNRHNKYKRGKVRGHRGGHAQVVVKPRNTRQRNWRQDGTRPKLNIPKNPYRPEAKKRGKKQNRRQQRRR